MKKILFLLLLCCELAAWSQTEFMTKTNVKYYDEMVYKSDSYASEKCILDIYLSRQAITHFLIRKENGIPET